MKNFKIRDAFFTFVSSAMFLTAFSTVEASHNGKTSGARNRIEWHDCERDYEYKYDDEYEKEKDLKSFRFREIVSDDEFKEFVPAFRIKLNDSSAALRDNGFSPANCNSGFGYNNLNLCIELLFALAVYGTGSKISDRYLMDGRDYILSYNENLDTVHIFVRDDYIGKSLEKIFREFCRLIDYFGDGCHLRSDRLYSGESIFGDYDNYVKRKSDSNGYFKECIDLFCLQKKSLFENLFNRIETVKKSEIDSNSEFVKHKEARLLEMLITFAKVFFGKQLDVGSIVASIRKVSDEKTDWNLLRERIFGLLQYFSKHIAKAGVCDKVFENED